MSRLGDLPDRLRQPVPLLIEILGYSTSVPVTQLRREQGAQGIDRFQPTIVPIDEAVAPRRFEHVHVRVLPERWARGQDTLPIAALRALPLLHRIADCPRSRERIRPIEDEEVSKELERQLKKRGIRHEVLNAKQHEREAAIVADAGRKSLAARTESLLATGQRVLALDPFYFGESKIKERDFLYALLVAATGVASNAEYVWLIVSIIVGALIGETIGYFLGKTFGPAIQHSKLGQFVGHKNWVAAEKFLDHRGGWAVFVSRFLPVLHSLVPLTAGIIGMDYRRFIAWTAPACTLWSILYVTVGHSVALSFDKLSESVHFAGYIFVGVILLFIAIMTLVKKALHKYAHDERKRD